MTTDNTGKKTAEKILEILGKVLGEYSDVVDQTLKQKLMQTTDYDRLLQRTQSVTANARTIQNKVAAHNLEMEYLNEVLDALIASSEALERIVIGLAKKASGGGAYGFFAYKGDLKTFNRLHQDYLGCVTNFASTIEAESPDDRIVCSAFILDPFSEVVIEEDVTIFRNEYDHSKDENGNVFIMRGYENGEQSSVFLKKDLWLEMKQVMIVPPEQREAEVKAMMDNLLNPKG